MPSNQVIYPALYQRHLALGAKTHEFGGWDMPMEYAAGGVVAEHTATREKVAVFDVSHLGTALIKGEGAKSELNKIFSNDLNRINPGRAQYNLLLTDAGGIVDDIFVYLKSDDEALIIPNASNSDEVLSILESHLPKNIEIKNLHQEISILAIQGPKSRSLIEKMNLSADIEYLSFAESEFNNQPITICRTGYTGEWGYELLIPSNVVEDFWNQLSEVGKEFELTPAGLGARDTLRTEMGYPLHGQDITKSISPVEAGLMWAVGLNKETFIGKLAVESEKIRGPKRKSFGLLAIDRAIPRSEMKVYLDEALKEEVGVITSGTFSPTLKQGIALGLLDAKLKLDQIVYVDVRSRAMQFKLVKPPFVPSSVR
ncbi:MAG: glycine cleavage system aminomethyltransferase GcvT [Candidatus Nanopelagicales bacterium]